MKPSITGILNLMVPFTLKLAPEWTGLNNCLSVSGRFHKMLRETIDEHERTLPDEDNPRDFIDAYLHEIKRTVEEDSSFYKEAGSKENLCVMEKADKTVTDSYETYFNNCFCFFSLVESLMAVVGDMFFAGSETTSVTLTWAMLYLAKNQEAQKKLQAEIDQVVGHSRQVSLTDRPK